MFGIWCSRFDNDVVGILRWVVGNFDAGYAVESITRLIELVDSDFMGTYDVQPG